MMYTSLKKTNKTFLIEFIEEYEIIKPIARIQL